MPRVTITEELHERLEAVRPLVGAVIDNEVGLPAVSCCAPRLPRGLFRVSRWSNYSSLSSSLS
jgi:hypothetical protein